MSLHVSDGPTEHVDLVNTVREDAARIVTFIPRPQAGKLERTDLMKQIIKAPKKHVTTGPKKDFRKIWLHVACMEGHLEAVTALVEAGADVNKMDDNKRTPLLYAVMTGELKVVRCLLDNGADIHHDECPDRMTAVYLAAEYGYPNVLKLLIQRGADVHKLCPNNMTLLHIVCQQGHPVEMLDILFDKNLHELEMDIFVKDAYGRTIVRMLKDATDRNPKPLNTVALAVATDVSKFRKLLNRVHQEIDERKRLRYYEELKQREKLEAKQRHLDNINNNEAVAEMEQKIQERLAALQAGEHLDDHVYDDWHSELMAHKEEEDAQQAALDAQKAEEELLAAQRKEEEEFRKQDEQLERLAEEQKNDEVLQAKRKKLIAEELNKKDAEKKRQEIEANFKEAQEKQERLKKEKQERLAEQGITDRPARGPMGAFPKS